MVFGVNFIEMQAELAAWSKKNFGEQPPHRPMLGIIEEIAELQEAWDVKDKNAIVDAVGDIGIYMLDYCVKRGWSFSDLWGYRSRGATPWATRLMSFVRRLAHHHLKGEQGIRGGALEHDQQLRSVLSDLLGVLQSFSESVGLNLPIIMREVWSKVRLRDWTKNPNDAHAVAEQQVLLSEGVAKETDEGSK